MFLTDILNVKLIKYILSCLSLNSIFSRYLRNVSVEHVEPAKPKVEFTADGVLKSAELKIMNLRPGVGNSLVWEEVNKTLSDCKENLLKISILNNI